MLPFPHGVTATVTRRTAASTDAYGNTTYTTTTHTIDGCGYAPTTGTADDFDVTDYGRDGWRIDATLLAPHGSDIEPDDLITVNGRQFTINGFPGEWSQPMTGWDAGISVALTRVEG